MASELELTSTVLGDALDQEVSEVADYHLQLESWHEQSLELEMCDQWRVELI